MVIGLEAFREAFKGYEDCYTIIGGTACDILMNKANLDFRATRDIDMILLIENRFEEYYGNPLRMVHIDVVGKVLRSCISIALQSHRIRIIQ